MTTHTATVDAAHFYRAVANAALFASTDDTLPVITSVHFVAGEAGTLLAEATNRYIASRENLGLIGHGHDTDHPGHDKCEPPSTTLNVLVERKGLVKIAKMLKQLEVWTPGGTERPKIIIEHTEGERHVALILTDHYAPDQTLRTEVVEGDFPKMGQFFSDHRKQPEPVPGFEDQPPLEVQADFQVAPAWLAALAKVGTGQKTDAIQFSPGLGGKRTETGFSGQPRETVVIKPLLVKIGESFRAMVMPVREAS